MSHDTCPNCGGRLYGDGVRTVRHRENVDSLIPVWEAEPDASPVYRTPDATDTQTPASTP